MRTPPSLLALVAGTTLVVGCKWTEFDDLEKDTWVGTTTKPSGDSTDFGLAIQRGTRTSASGGKLIALGSSEVIYHELGIASNGATDASVSFNITDASSVSAVDVQPILIADPASDDAVLVVGGLGDRIEVWKPKSGAPGQLDPVSVFGPSSPDAATFLLPRDAATETTADASQPLIASGDTVYGAYYGTAPVPQPSCQLTDAANTPTQIRGLGAVKLVNTAATDPHDLVVWSSAGGVGKLMLYSGAVFHGATAATTCAGGLQAPLATANEVTTTFAPGRGSQILMIDDRYALLVGHEDPGAGTGSFLALYDLRAMNGANFEPAIVGNAITNPDLRTATLLDAGGQKYVVAGYPNAMFDGVRAGNVVAFPLDLTTGIDATPAMTLHDASPEDDQRFGRAVAVTEFNGTPVLAVGADNEVFLYFRTALYDETRQ